MPRELVLGNGQLLINFDAGLNMRDLYYPYVGQHNHIGGHKNSFGFWCDGNFAWCDDPGWRYNLGYQPRCLVTKVSGVHQGLRLEIEGSDAVHYRDNIYLKKLLVRNLEQQHRTVLVFFNHDFSIDESDVGDTACYDPVLNTVYHYKRSFYFMADGLALGKGVEQYATGIKRFGGAEGTWRDAEDGKLEGNPIAQGSVDSTIGFRLELEPGSEQVLYYWLTCGHNYQEARRLTFYVRERTPENLLRRTEYYWRNWLRQGKRVPVGLPTQATTLFHTSLLLIRTHIDNRGGIIAATDSDIMQFNRDHYNYVWPRDAALISQALIQANHSSATENFLRFCANSITRDGYLLHKYNSDGTAGSSWHPWYREGQQQLPIQEDETALVVLTLWKHYCQERNLEFVESLYRSLVEPAAEFMCRYIYEELDLPRESYDLWEEKRGIWTFTSSAVYAGLRSAARIARLFADNAQAARYDSVADRISLGISRYLYDRERKRFLKGITLDRSGNIQPDLTLESSVLGLNQFRVLPARDKRMVSTVAALEKDLWNFTEIGGLARYDNDLYFYNSEDVRATSPGNPWVICTLWLAQWYIAAAQEQADLQRPLELINWACRRASAAGILPEQVTPFSGRHLSVAPLTWSHSTFVETVIKYSQKCTHLLKKKTGSVSTPSG